MTDKKMIRGTPDLAERLLRHVTGQGSPLLDVGEAWKAGEAVTQGDLELAIEELEDLLEGGITEEEREEISDLRAELGKLHAGQWNTGPGAEIRRRRKALGWTQQELAERSGVRVATISDIETAKAQNTRRSTLNRITAVLDAESWGEERLLKKLAEIAEKAVPRTPESPVRVPDVIQRRLGLRPALDGLVEKGLIEPLKSSGPKNIRTSRETYRITRKGWQLIYELDPWLAMPFGFPYVD